MNAGDVKEGRQRREHEEDGNDDPNEGKEHDAAARLHDLGKEGHGGKGKIEENRSGKWETRGL